MTATALLVLALWPASTLASPQPPPPPLPVTDMIEPTTAAPSPLRLPAPSSGAPVVDTYPRWYGWQTLVAVVGWSVVVNALPKGTNSGTLNVLGSVGLAAAPVAVHVINRDPKKIGYWAAAVAGGTMLSYFTLQLLRGSLAESSDTQANHADADFSFSLLGGTAVAAMLDAAAFTWQRVPVMPAVTPVAGGGAAFVVGGRF
jgi:hypothetical protein